MAKNVYLLRSENTANSRKYTCAILQKIDKASVLTAPRDTVWHKEPLKLKEIFGTKEGFEIRPHQLSLDPIKASVGA